MPDVPDDVTFERVTYRAPVWAFRDRLGNKRDRAEVFWPGRAVFKSNPHMTFEMNYEPPVDGKSTYEPDDAFCELSVGAKDAGLLRGFPSTRSVASSSASCLRARR